MTFMGMIFDIQHFCYSDGPGIRTTVFIKGCPLNCLWCHNPEGKNISTDIMYNSKLCVGCLNCVKKCSYGCHTFEDGVHIFNREKCTLCGECAMVCIYGALSLSGKNMSSEEIIAEVMMDLPYYERTGGGLTLSGGEPLASSEFTLQILKEAKSKGLHTALETSGYCETAVLEEIRPFVDLFFLI